MVSGTRRKGDDRWRLRKNILNRETDIVDDYKVWDESTSLSSLAGGGTPDRGNGSGIGNFMPLANGTWLGPYGNQNAIVTIEDGVINASNETGADSSFIIINGEGGMPDVLDWIITGDDVLFFQEEWLQTYHNITFRPRASFVITNIVGDGTTNTITVTVVGGAGLETGDTIQISNTNNFNSDLTEITKTGPDTFTYQYTTVGSATPETSGDVDRGNIEIPNNVNYISQSNNISKWVYDTVRQVWQWQSAFNASGGGGGGGANIQLSNLGMTAVNSSLIPNSLATLDLGSELLPWRIGHFREIEFPVTTSPPTAATDTQISVNTSNNMAFNNSAAGGGYLWYFQGISKWSLSSTSLSGDNIILQNVLTLNDQSADPNVNGQFARNGADVKVFTGGNLVNLSNLVAGANIQLSNLGTTSINSALLPDTGGTLDLGSELLPWRIGHFREIEFIGTTSPPTAATDDQIAKNNSGNFHWNNAAAGGGYIWYFQGVAEWAMTNSSFQGDNIILQNTLTLNDQAADPNANGQFARDGADVKVFSGGAVRNLSNIVQGANIQLSNLGTTSINSALIPNAANSLDFGSELLPWRIGHFREIEFIGTTAVPSAATDDQIGKNPSGNFHWNNATLGGGYIWYFQGVAEWAMTSSSFQGDNIILQQSLTINDTSLDPNANGQFRRNGADVKVYSGGAVRNLSNIGGTGANIQLSNLGTTAINADMLPGTTNSLDLGSASRLWAQVHTPIILSPVSLNISAPTSLTLNSSLILLGDTATDNISFLGRVSSNILPSTSGNRDLGSTSLVWDELHVRDVYSDQDLRLESGDDIFIDAIDDISFRRNGVTRLQYDGGNDYFVVETDWLIDNGRKIRSRDSTEVGFFVTDYSGSIGTEGSLQPPYNTGSAPGNISGWATDFGDALGCEGWYFNNGGSSLFVKKVGTNRWLSVLYVAGLAPVVTYVT